MYVLWTSDFSLAKAIIMRLVGTRTDFSYTWDNTGGLTEAHSIKVRTKLDRDKLRKAVVAVCDGSAWDATETLSRLYDPAKLRRLVREALAD